MKTQGVFLVLAMTAFGMAQTAAATDLALAFGSSLPASLTSTTDVDQKGPSRTTGGEVFDIQFKAAKTVTAVKLSAYSTGGQGQVLVHYADATVSGANGATATALGDLFSFADKGAGLYNDYKGNVMLENNNYVLTNVNQSVTDLKVQLEGFIDNDATIFIEVTTSEDVNYYDFTVTRTPAQPVNNGGNNGGGNTGGATYQWVGNSCDLVTPEGYVVSSGYPASYCGGATYTWVGNSCDLVTPEGYVVSSGYPATYCAGATYEWVGASCDLVTPEGYVVSSGYPSTYCGGATYQWVGASCDLVTPAGYVVSSGYPATYCGVR